MSGTFNVIKISGLFCQQAETARLPELETIVHNGRVFAAQAVNLHPEIPAENRINAVPLKAMWQAAKSMAYYADLKDYKSVVLPHEGYSERGQMVRREICEPLSRFFGLDVRLQRGVYVLDEAKVDPRVRTCLEQGAIHVLRINSDILSLKRAA